MGWPGPHHGMSHLQEKERGLEAGLCTHTGGLFIGNGTESPYLHLWPHFNSDRVGPYAHKNPWYHQLCTATARGRWAPAV